MLDDKESFITIGALILIVLVVGVSQSFSSSSTSTDAITGMLAYKRTIGYLDEVTLRSPTYSARAPIKTDDAMDYYDGKPPKESGEEYHDECTLSNRRCYYSNAQKCMQTQRGTRWITVQICVADGCEAGFCTTTTYRYSRNE